MGIGDWITLGAVIVALGIGVAAILHTQSLQKRERKERLLNEIIEWTEDILACGVVLDSTDFKALSSSLTNRQYEFFVTEKQSRELSRLLTRGVRMSGITLKLNESKTLWFLVGKTRENLNSHIKLLELVQQGKVKKQDSIARHREVINICVKKLIEEATKIKTRGIS